MAETSMISPLSAVWLVITREWRAQRNAFLGWLLPLAGLLGAVAGIQPSMAGKDSLLAAKMAALPENVKAAFGLGHSDFSRPAGYMATNFLIVTLGATLFAAILGASVVSREDTQRTTESLLTLPIARWQVLLGKAIAAVTMLAVFHGVMLGVSLGVLASVVTGDLQAGPIASMFGGAVLLGLLFFAVGFAVATVLKESRSAPNIALGLVLGTYFLGATSRLAPKAEALNALSPFDVVEPTAIAQSGSLESKAIWLLVLGIAFLAAAILRYQRRDVHA